MKKYFKNISEVIRDSRNEAGMTQLELAKCIGYDCGQFVSNLERGMCSLPLNRVKVTCQTLGIKPANITNALLMDYQIRLKEAVR